MQILINLKVSIISIIGKADVNKNYGKCLIPCTLRLLFHQKLSVFRAEMIQSSVC